MVTLVHHRSNTTLGLSQLFEAELSLRETLQLLPKLSARFAEHANLDALQVTECVRDIVIGLPLINVLPKLRDLDCTLTVR